MRAARWSRALMIAMVMLGTFGVTLSTAPAVVGTTSAAIEPIDPEHPVYDQPLSGKNAPSGGEEPNGHNSGETSFGAIAIVIGALVLLGIGAKVLNR